MVERFNRTLKTAMWKYFYNKGTYKWVDVLADLVHNYNNTKHGTTLKKPKAGNKRKEAQHEMRCIRALKASLNYHYTIVY